MINQSGSARSSSAGRASRGVLRGAAPVLAAVLGAALLAGSPAADAASLGEVQPAITNLTVTPRTIWPAAEDRGDKAMITFSIAAPGDYRGYIEDHGGTIAGHDFGHLEPGTYSWQWGGRDSHQDTLAREAKHFVHVYGWRDDGEELGTEEIAPVWVKLGSEEILVSDRRDERGSRGVDIDFFTLRNGPKSATVTFDFHGRARPAAASASIQLDVDKRDKGYLLTRGKDRAGTMRTTLYLANLGSDVGKPTKIRCPRIKTRATTKSLTITVPRACMKRGGHKLRATYSVWAGHHMDYGPDGARAYWTRWATYEVAPE
ncbi:hypothetical protein ACT8ZV_23065 [Nocardioides sp. MAHUQ-72]|uniref:hypothetical protein n=1 Tax=unclassified Nocardioides TaxID=2615069 RepID=UPI00360ABBD5